MVALTGMSTKNPEELIMSARQIILIGDMQSIQEREVMEEENGTSQAINTS